MNLYIPKDLINYLDDNKGDTHSRESLIISLIKYARNHDIDLENVKKEDKYDQFKRTEQI